MDSGLFSPTGSHDIKFTETQDGVVLYCVIRLKDEFQDLKDNDTSAIKDIFRQTCDSPDEKVPKIGNCFAFTTKWGLGKLNEKELKIRLSVSWFSN